MGTASRSEGLRLLETELNPYIKYCAKEEPDAEGIRDPVGPPDLRAVRPMGEAGEHGGDEDQGGEEESFTSCNY